MQKLILTALVAGFIAGIVSFGIQQVKLSPMILHAEVYEDAAEQNQEQHHDAVASEEHHHDENAWQPENGFERNAYRALADIGVGVGYALLLVGAIVLSGDKVNLQKGALWGVAGFAVFSLAPSFGLSPELPGSMAADLYARQIWWIATAVATAAGLAMLAFSRANIWKIIGIVAIALPHIIGAPETEIMGGSVPPELNAGFAAASIGVAAVFWVVLGAVSGWFYGRQNLTNNNQNRAF